MDRGREAAVAEVLELRQAKEPPRLSPESFAQVTRIQAAGQLKIARLFHHFS